MAAQNSKTRGIEVNWKNSRQEIEPILRRKEREEAKWIAIW